MGLDVPRAVGAGRAWLCPGAGIQHQACRVRLRGRVRRACTRGPLAAGEGTKQVLGLWVGPATGESAKFWLSVLSELRSRGVADGVHRVLRRADTAGIPRS